MRRFSDNAAAAIGEYLGMIIPGTDTGSAQDRKMTLEAIAKYVGAGRPPRELALTDLFGTTDAQKAIRYAAAQPDAVCLCDYVDLPAFSFTDDVTGASVGVTTTGQNTRIRVAANPSSYTRLGDTETPKSILFEFANCPFQRAVNANGSNAGDYVASELRTVLNGGFAAALQQVVGSSNEIVATRRLLSTGDSSADWGWYGEKVFAPTETEVFGTKNVGDTDRQLGDMFQLPLYALYPHKKVKGFNGARRYWWLASAYRKSANASFFAFVDSTGSAYWRSASSVSGVSPAFGIKNQ